MLVALLMLLWEISKDFSASTVVTDATPLAEATGVGYQYGCTYWLSGAMPLIIAAATASRQHCLHASTDHLHTNYNA